jgi:sugar lactone lactonase YvrE
MARTWAGRPCHEVPAAVVLLVLFASLVFLSGCDRPAGAADSSSHIQTTSWLETGNAPGQVVYPRAITYDAVHDWVYIVDRQAHIQRLDAATGAYLAGWSMPEFQQGKPVGLSVGPDGNLYVPDTHYHRVLVFDPDGHEIRRWGSRGTAPGQFIYPTDIAFSPDGKVFVGEYGDNDRIQVFSPTGEYLYHFGHFGQSPGEFSRPQSLLIVGNELYLTDACNHRIQVFSLDGKFLRTFGSAGSDPGQFRFPYGLELTAAGNLLVTEFGNNRIQVLTREGRSLTTWGTGGHQPGELAYPWAATVDKRGRVLIVDSGNNRVQILPVGVVN